MVNFYQIYQKIGRSFEHVRDPKGDSLDSAATHVIMQSIRVPVKEG